MYVRLSVYLAGIILAAVVVFLLLLNTVTFGLVGLTIGMALFGESMEAYYVAGAVAVVSAGFLALAGR